MSFETINNYFTKFIRENGDEDFVSLWTSKTQQKEFKTLFNKAVPKKSKKNKDKNAPVRNLNSYMQFCKVIRPKIKEEISGIDSKEILREMGKRWGLLNDSQKEKYVLLAEADKKRYEEAKKNYTPPESQDEDENDAPKKERKKRAKKNPEAPKGAANSYLLFCKTEKETVKEETGLEGTELKTELTSRWKNHKEAKDEVFEKYQAMADEDKARFKAENEAYKAKTNDEEVVEEKSKTKETKKNAKAKEEEQEEDLEEEEEIEEEEKPKTVKPRKNAKAKEEEQEDLDEEVEEEEKKSKTVKKETKPRKNAKNQRR
jgi:hypothetical protein